MKTIKLLSTLLILAIASHSFAQQALFHFPTHHSSFNHFPFKESYSKKMTRSTSYVPLNESDSTYDDTTKSWVYGQDVAYQYFTTDCNDSVATYSINGTPQYRILYYPYIDGFYTGYTFQSWNGKKWDDTAKEVITLQNGAPCIDAYDIYEQWDGASWDTIYGSETQTILNSHGNPLTQIYYQWAGGWVLTGAEQDFYNANDTITGINEITYNSMGQIQSIDIDTNMVWSTFNSYCDLSVSYLEQLSYDSTSSSYKKAIEYYLTPTMEEEIDWQWTGSVYDTTGKTIIMLDSHGNEISDVVESYDSIAHAWFDNIAYAYKYVYGANNEIISYETLSTQCAPNFDSIYPCSLAHYSNYVACTGTNGVQTIADNKDILIYPNPASGNFTIVLPLQIKNATVEIYNSIGQLVKNVNSFNDSRLNINTSGLSAGMYYVRVISGAMNNTAKIVIE